MKRLILILFLFTVVFCSHAQTYTTFGTDFWVAFLANGAPNYTDTATSLTVSLTFSSDRPVSGNILNPNTNWNTSFTLEANHSVQIEIPKEQAYNYFIETIQSRGLHITTTDSVWVYASNYHKQSFDIANIAPVEMLSSRYMIQTYPYAYDPYGTYGGCFLIVATENNTTVQITPKNATIGGHSANTMFSVLLNAGKSYYVASDNSLSGSIVQALDDKKIAVYNGVPCGFIPEELGACDHSFEQAFPSYFWGEQFAVVGAMGRNEDRICITALVNNTIVKKNNVQVATLQAGNTWEIILATATTPSCFIETSKPATVYQYFTNGITSNGREGDPSSAWICPVEYFTKKSVNQIYPTEVTSTHFVNIITKSDNVSLMQLNNQNIETSFTPLSGNSEYAFAQILLTDTINILENDSGFIAYYYGTGDTESYFYNASFQKLFNPPQIAVNEIPYILLPENQVFCISDSVHFSCSVDYEYNDIIWVFGDGETANGCAASHLYAEEGDYQVRMIVDRTYPNLNNDMYDTVYAVLHLDNVRILNILDTICQGENYNQYGFEVIQPEIGLTLDTIIFPGLGCDSLNILNLTVLSNGSSEQILGDDVFCLDHTYTFTVSNAAFFETFVWTVPNGCEIISGQNTSVLQVHFSDNMTSGNISVSIANSCGSHTYQKSIDLINVDDYVVSGGGAVCEEYNAAIHLNMSQAGVTYRILCNGNIVGDDWIGDGMMHDFGPYSVSGSYSVYMIVPDCYEGYIGESVTIKIIPTPPERIIHGN